MQGISAYDASGRAQLEQLAADAKALVGEAPAAIHNDVDAVAKYMAIAATRPPTSAEDDAVQAAGERVGNYLSAKCSGSAAASDTTAAARSTTTLDTTAETTPDTTFETTPLPSITMPNLANATVDDARTRLTSAGIATDPVIVEQKDATVAPGIVITQNPYAGSPVAADDIVTLTVSALPDQAYLADFKATDGQFRTGVASIKGVPYTHGVLQQQGYNYGPVKTTFTLSSHFSRLKGFVGLDDSFTGGASVQVEIFDQDNKSLFKRTVKVGQPVTLDISVTGVIQLTLDSTDLLVNAANSGNIVWADLQVMSAS